MRTEAEIMTGNVIASRDAEGDLVLTSHASEIHVRDFGLTEGTGRYAANICLWTRGATDARRLPDQVLDLPLELWFDQVSMLGFHEDSCIFDRLLLEGGSRALDHSRG